MTKILKVQGMSCGGCANTVETYVGEIDGVTSVKVDLDKAEVTVEITEEDIYDKVKAAITGQGYVVA